MQAVFEPSTSRRSPPNWPAVPLGDRTRPGSRSSSTAAPLPRAGLRRPRHVGEDRSQSAVERLQVHLRGRDRVDLRPTADGRGARSTSATPASAFPPRSCRVCSSASIASDARGRTHEGTGIGLALVQELVDFTAERCAPKASPGRGTAFTRHDPAGQRPSAQGSARRQSERGRRRASPPKLLEEALRWLPRLEHGRARRTTPPKSWTRSGRSPRSGRTVLLADDNADMREYVRRLLARSATRSKSLQDGEARAGRCPARSAGPDPERRHDAAARRLRPLARDTRRSKPCATPVILLSARAGEEARSKAWTRARTTIWSSRSARASCWPGSAPIWTWRRCGAKRSPRRMRCGSRRRPPRSARRRSWSSISDGFFALDATGASPMSTRPRSGCWAERGRADRQKPLGGVSRSAPARRWRQIIAGPCGSGLASLSRTTTMPWERWFDTRVSPAGDGGLSVYFRT